MVSTYQFWAKILPLVISMWCRSEDSTIVTPHLLQLSLVQFRSQKMVSSPIACRFYVSLPCCTKLIRGCRSLPWYYSGSCTFLTDQTYVRVLLVWPIPRWYLFPWCGRPLHKTLCIAPTAAHPISQYINSTSLFHFIIPGDNSFTTFPQVSSSMYAVLFIIIQDTSGNACHQVVISEPRVYQIPLCQV